MKKQILFFHSAGAQGAHQGSSDLVAYLQKELSHDYNVHVVNMPNADNPSFEAWRKKTEEALEAAEDGVIIIGHSLGGSVMLKQLSEHPYHKSIAGLFLVALPYWGKQDWEISEYALEENFAENLPQIPTIALYHSRRDDIVPFSHLKAYAKKLPQAFVCEMEGKEHQFQRGLPELVQDIKSLQRVRQKNTA